MAGFSKSFMAIFYCDRIAVTDTARFDANTNMSRRRLCHTQVHCLELAGRDRLYRSVRCAHVRFT